MQNSTNYWMKTLVTRRRALRVAAGGAAFGALSLVGCGGGSDSGGGGGEIKDIGNVPRVTEEDSKKGKPGGRLVIQPTGYATTLVLATTNNNSTAGLAGFTHSGLLSLKNGRPIVDGSDVSVQPDLAVALPERPDQMTYIFKLNDARFHNGRTVTSEDVKYSLERYAFAADSAYKQNWTWLDKVENPDAKTVVVKTKAPYADAIGALAGYSDGFIMAKEHEESAEAKNKLMGSGPFIFVNTESPVITRFKKNPDYFMKPYPYLDEIHMLGNADFAKRYADFAAKNNHVTYWHAADERDQLRQARPDAKLFQHQYAGYNVVMRTDQAPFKDERVRQALSMAIDRKALREATSKGEGEPDQAFSWTIKTWGFRKPAELGAAAKYWNLDVQTAKQLMSAAGVTRAQDEDVALGPDGHRSGLRRQRHADSDAVAAKPRSSDRRRVAAVCADVLNGRGRQLRRYLLLPRRRRRDQRGAGRCLQERRLLPARGRYAADPEPGAHQRRCPQCGRRKAGYPGKPGRAQGDLQDHGTDHGRQDVPHHHQYVHHNLSCRSEGRQYPDADHGYQ